MDLDDETLVEDSCEMMESPRVRTLPELEFFVPNIRSIEKPVRRLREAQSQCGQFHDQE